MNRTEDEFYLLLKIIDLLLSPDRLLPQPGDLRPQVSHGALLLMELRVWVWRGLVCQLGICWSLILQMQNSNSREQLLNAH